MERMNFNDIRYNNYHIIEFNSSKWSKNWNDFPGPSYIPLLSTFEEWSIDTFDMDSIHKFMQDCWHYSLYASIVYITSIPILRLWMEARGRPYHLRTLLIIWNSLMAFFSIIGVIRCVPEFYYIWKTKGFVSSYCQSDYYMDGRLFWWYLVFVCSKILELIDTLFILLRNGKLLKLHYVHHCLTLCYCWYVFGEVPATARWMVNMNLMVHSLMYTYYALKALRLPIPRLISISITSIQILQMVFGLYINYKIIEYKRSGIPCDVSPSVAVTGLLLYSLFLIMFSNFFIDSYLLKPIIKKSVKNSVKTENNNKGFIVNKNLNKGKLE